MLSLTDQCQLLLSPQSRHYYSIQSGDFNITLSVLIAFKMGSRVSKKETSNFERDTFIKLKLNANGCEIPRLWSIRCIEKRNAVLHGLPWYYHAETNLPGGSLTLSTESKIYDFFSNYLGNTEELRKHFIGVVVVIDSRGASNYGAWHKPKRVLQMLLEQLPFVPILAIAKHQNQRRALSIADIGISRKWKIRRYGG